MRRIGGLMRDMGFNADAPEATQRAFIRHLVRAAESTSLRNSSHKVELKPSGEQLSFDPEVLGTLPVESKKKKTCGAR